MTRIRALYLSWCQRCGHPCDYTREAWRAFVQSIEAGPEEGRWIEGRLKRPLPSPPPRASPPTP